MYPRKTDPTAGIFVHRECLALKRARLDVRVLSPLPYSPRILWWNPKWRDLGMVPRSDILDGIHVRYPRYPRPPGAFYRKFEPFAMLPTLCASFREWSREKPFDLIHAHGLLPWGVAAVLLSKAFRLPCVCQARGGDVNIYAWESRANFLLTRYVIENCDAPLAVSKALAEKMSSISRTGREISVLYTTVDTQLFAPARDRVLLRRRLGIPPGAFVAIYVGALCSEKGLIDLSAAWRVVTTKAPGSTLVILGKGPLYPKLASLGHSVLLCGPKPHAEVALWMQASDVLILPSHSEGLPTVIVEAMACELPVIATPVGGIPEAVIHGETGFLVPTGAHQSLASSIITLARNRELRRFMAKAGRERMRAVFGPNTYVPAALEMYHWVVRHRANTKRQPPSPRAGSARAEPGCGSPEKPR